MNDDECETFGGGGLVGGSAGECVEAPVETGLFNEDDDTGALEYVGGGGCAHVGGPGLWVWVVAAWTLRRVLVGLLAGLVGMQSASAQDVQLLEVMEGGTFMSVHPADVGPAWSGAVATTGSAAMTPVAVTTNQAFRKPYMTSLLTLDSAVTFAFGRVLGVGVGLPVHRATWAENGSTALGQRPPHQTDPGDIKLWATLPIRSQRSVDHPLALRVEVDRRTPGSDLLGQNAMGIGFASEHRFLGGTLGWHGLVRLQGRVVLPGVTIGNQIRYALGYQRGIGGEDARLHGGIELFGSVPLGIPRGLRDMPLEALGSVRYALFGRVQLHGGIGVGVTRSIGVPISRGIVGVRIAGHAPRDSDGDGLRNLVDRCRFEPEDRDGFRDGDGCPDPDNDEDGLLDPQDSCPDQAEVVNGYADEDGCPDALSEWRIVVQAAADSELQVAELALEGRIVQMVGGEARTWTLVPGSRGIAVTAPGFQPVRHVEELVEGKRTTTTVTLLPIQLGQLSVSVVDPAGEPVPEAVLAIDDVERPMDAGRFEGEVVSGPTRLVAAAPGFVQQEVQIDVPPEVAGRATHRFVLQPTGVRREGAQVRVGTRPLFALDSARLDPEALPGLDDLAAWLLAHPEIELLRVEGHADSVGGSRYNLELSEHRAESVLDGLVQRGVARSRLVAVGSGEALTWSGAERAVAFTVLVDARW